MQWSGAKPQSNFWAELTPSADEKEPDAGPGARRKSPTGEWLAIGMHPLDKSLRR